MPTYGTAPFEAGRYYSRKRDVHGVYEGQRQGGMSTPARYPFIFLFTGAGGEAHGYRDEFRSDGTYWYTGEGQVGDMEFVRANRALRDHERDGKRVFLFEAVGDGRVRFMHEVRYLDHHRQQRPDTAGDLRQAIVFELEVIDQTEEAGVAREPVAGVTSRRSTFLADLRRLALAPPARYGARERREVVRVRAEAVREYVYKRARGRCEGCGRDAPFRTKARRPYLEAHHTTRMADGGPDHPAHVIALCPTCHRRAHYAQDAEAYNEQLVVRLQEIEPRG